MIKIDCVTCGRQFSIYRAWLGKRKNCSKDCFIQYLNKNRHIWFANVDRHKPIQSNPIMKSCGICKKEFRTYKSHFERRKFCSKECHIEWQHTLSGEKSVSWKGGYSNPLSKFRTNSLYRKLRHSILERANNKCENCGSGERLELEHIKPFSVFQELRYEPTNCKILCRECHKKTETYGAKIRSLSLV